MGECGTDLEPPGHRSKPQIPQAASSGKLKALQCCWEGQHKKQGGGISRDIFCFERSRDLKSLRGCKWSSQKAVTSSFFSEGLRRVFGENIY